MSESAEIDHMAEAERLIATAEGTYWEGPTSQIEFAQTCLMAAQAHATLAVAQRLTSSGGPGGPGCACGTAGLCVDCTEDGVFGHQVTPAAQTGPDQ